MRGYNRLTGQWDQLDYGTTSNGISFERNLEAGIYTKLDLYYYGYAISSSQLQPGDLIFWSKACTCGRWNEIHHTGIYIGDGRIVDASSSKGRVVLRSLWGENGSAWKIVLYARPHV